MIPTNRLAPESERISDDDLMKIIHASFPEKQRAALIRTKWKDGIDIDEPSFYAWQFADAILSHMGGEPIADAAKLADELWTDLERLLHDECGLRLDEGLGYQRPNLINAIRNTLRTFSPPAPALDARTVDITRDMIERGKKALHEVSTYRGYNEETLAREYIRMESIYEAHVKAVLKAILSPIRADRGK